jgi:hypothetical protein
MPRSRGWVFTRNNPTPNTWLHYRSIASGGGCRYCVLGKERGPETGTPHIQGYIYFKTKKSFTQVKSFFGDNLHIEAQRGTCKEAIDYCKKEGDFEEFGNPPLTRQEAGKRSDELRRKRNLELLDGSLDAIVRRGSISILQVPVLQKARLIIRQEAEPYTHPTVRGIWIHGPPGTGKSHRARTEFSESLYVKAQNKWFDGYTGQKYILMDDFDCPALGHYLKIWLDKWSCSGEVKNATVNLRHEKFIITSNYLPGNLWPEDPILVQAISRRCEFILMDEIYTPTSA